jgi:hypothetical protein
VRGKTEEEERSICWALQEFPNLKEETMREMPFGK